MMMGAEADIGYNGSDDKRSETKNYMEAYSGTLLLFNT